MNLKKLTIITTIFTALTACIFLYKKPITETKAATLEFEDEKTYTMITNHNEWYEKAYDNESALFSEYYDEIEVIKITSYDGNAIQDGENYNLTQLPIYYLYINPTNSDETWITIGTSEGMLYLINNTYITFIVKNNDYIVQKLPETNGYYMFSNEYRQETIEVIDLPGLMLEILSMPFTFITTAFNVTIFPGTQYQINFANLFKGLLAILALLFIVKLFTKGLDAIGTINDNRSDRQWKKETRQMQREKHKNEMNKKD